MYNDKVLVVFFILIIYIVITIITIRNKVEEKSKSKNVSKYPLQLLTVEISRNKREKSATILKVETNSTCTVIKFTINNCVILN